MNDEIKINRQPSQAPQSSMTSEYKEKTQQASKGPWLVLALVVAVILILGGLFRQKLFSKPGSMQSQKETKTVSGQKYQAVFLTNGQVYFGKISNTNSDWVTMSSIYYLQVIQQQPLQGTPQGQQQPGQQQITLVKLGQELHGPVDEMHINKQQILFWEDLKADGQVVQAIEKNLQETQAPAK